MPAAERRFPPRRGLALPLAAGMLLAVPALAQSVNDYPTETRAEYVMICMDTNGINPDTLRRCSCAIDTIAGIVPHDDYVAAETVLRMRQTTGDRAAMFRSGAMSDGLIAELRRAEAEAEVICF